VAAARERADDWLDGHRRVALALHVVVPGGAIALASLLVGGQPLRRALLSGAVFSVLYGVLSYSWSDWNE
jgi:hypothetical protein